MKFDISRDEIEEYINSLQKESQIDSRIDIEFQNATCVLFRFDPYQIYPFSLEEEGVHNEKNEWLNFFRYSDPVEGKISGNWWQLRPSVRRQALMRLYKEGKIIEALEANTDRVQDEQQKLYEQVLRNKMINIDGMSRIKLVDLSLIIEWVKDILPEIEETSRRIKRAIPLADLLAPLHRLADVFVGRRTELKGLEQYIGVVPSTTSRIKAATRFITELFIDIEKNPPFLIYGPGGVGKSTLLAKFILDNTTNNDKEPLPFAYLDIDKAVIDVEWPESFVIEAARQLSTQSPEQRDEFILLKNELERMRWNYDLVEISKSHDSSRYATETFGKIVSKIKTPVLLVIDTFEEAQFLGEDVVHVIWRLLAELQRVAPNLRTVVMGRTQVKEYPVRELMLTELSRDEGRELLGNELQNLDTDEKTRDIIIDEIINTAGLNPLSLQLALTIVKQQGIEKLKKIETKNIFYMRLREEVIQARLYGRILAQVHDNEVRKLAYPGLIVRRINPDIILSVLAGPCQLKIETWDQANDLFERLRDEGALMTQDLDNDSLVHRADVRKLMLEDLKSKVPAGTVRALHDLAIQYYNKKTDLISRAEEIYHRLSRGDDPEKIAARWIEGLEPRLRNALEELPVDARIWLSGRLGVTPEANLLKKAGLEKWEEITARSVQRLLSNDSAAIALELMRVRSDRTPTSRLYRLELEALRLLGLYEEALFTVNKALAALPSSASSEFAHMLLLQATLVNEALNKIDEAIEYIKEAEKLLGDPLGYPIEAIRIYITHIRLLRKKGQSEDRERSVLIKRVMRMVVQDGEKISDFELNELIEKKIGFKLNATVTRSLRSSPALLQELVAELGKVVSQLIRYALDYIGIDLRNDMQKNLLANAFKNWNDQLASFSQSGPGELVERSGITSNSVDSWLTYINKNTGRTLGSAIYNWQYEILAHDAKSQSTYDFDKVLVDISRKNVEMAINKAVY